MARRWPVPSRRDRRKWGSVIGKLRLPSGSGWEGQSSAVWQCWRMSCRKPWSRNRRVASRWGRERPVSPWWNTRWCRRWAGPSRERWWSWGSVRLDAMVGSRCVGYGWGSTSRSVLSNVGPGFRKVRDTATGTVRGSREFRWASMATKGSGPTRASSQGKHRPSAGCRVWWKEMVKKRF